ncbi:hypothetical protein H4219_004689 [Mycoemilia scoparia]|uniref:Uncharacterized protein n=1 Tax=Mycoemilia scoparia TaxID=417184 RepID=A0A9W8DL42_9FUNG|nr:hypothetical protein H4219_004689 [Mycoemilia scoparia]
MSTTTDNNGSSDDLERVFKLLSRKSTDDEKFAGLMVLNRYNHLPKSFDDKSNEMSNTSTLSTPKNDNSQDDKNKIAMVDLALNVIITFTASKDFLTNKRFTNMLKSLSNLLLLKNQNIVKDAGRAICVLTESKEGLEKACRKHEIPANVTKALQYSSHNSNNEENQQILLQIIRNVVMSNENQILNSNDQELICGYTRWLLGLSEIYAKRRDSVQQTILMMLPFVKWSEHLGQTIAQSSTTTAESSHQESSKDLASIIKNIMAGTMPIIQQKGGHIPLRHLAIVNGITLLRLWPKQVFSIAHHTSGSNSNSNGNDVEGDKTASINKFPSLITKIAFIEGHVAIDSLMTTYKSMKNTDMPASESLSRAYEIVKEKPDIIDLAIVWEIGMIMFKVLDEISDPDLDINREGEEAVVVDDSVILELMQPLRSFLMTVVEFVKDTTLKEFPKSPSTMIINIKNPYPISNFIILLLEWLQSDITAHREAIDILPLLTDIVKTNPNNNNSTKNHQNLSDLKYAIQKTVHHILESAGITINPNTSSSTDNNILLLLQAKDKSKSGVLVSPWIGTMEFQELVDVLAKDMGLTDSATHILSKAVGVDYDSDLDDDLLHYDADDDPNNNNINKY